METKFLQKIHLVFCEQTPLIVSKMKKLVKNKFIVRQRSYLSYTE